MKSILSLSLVFLFCTQLTANSTACETLYSKVGYALSHTKKSLSSTNIEHLAYYAERALIALEKSRGLITECGCSKAENISFEVFKTLANATNPHDWEAGRFYSKKSLEQINDMITFLDECSMGTTFISESEQIELNSNKDIEAINQREVETYLADLETQFLSSEKAIDNLVNALKENQLPFEENDEKLNTNKKAYLEQTKKMLTAALERLE